MSQPTISPASGKIKTLARLLTAALTILVLQADYAPAQELSDQERDYLQQKGEVVFVSQTHYPPFEFLENTGDHTGMCIELAQWIATSFGFKARFIDTSFQQAQQTVQGGRADVITSLFYSKKRAQAFDFTQAMFKVPAFIFVRADRPDIKDIADLNGKTVAMQAGDYAQEFLESRHIRYQVTWTKDFGQATDLVIAGKADAVLGDEQIVRYYLYVNHLTEAIKKVGEPLYVGRNCMAVKQGSHLLQGILDKGIALARQTGTLDRIRNTWLGVRYPIPESFIVRYRYYFLAGAGALILLVLLVWVWNLRLRTLVARRTRALARTEETLKAILAKSPLGIGLVKNRVVGWHNEAMGSMLGYGPGELEGLEFSLLFPDQNELRRTDAAVSRTLREHGARVETRCLCKDGAVLNCLLHFALLERQGDDATMILIAEDIGERKRAEEALRQSEEKFRLLAEDMTDIVWTVGLDFMTTYVSPSVERMLGFTPEERKRQSLEEMVTPESSRAIKETFLRELVLEAEGADPDRTVKMEVEYYRKDGSTIWAENLVKAVRDPGGEIIGMHGVSRGITERKRAEEELARSERQYRLLAENVIDVILTVDSEFRITYVSPSVETLLGYTPEELSLQGLGKIMSDESLSSVREVSGDILDRIAGGERKIPTLTMEAEHIHKDGSRVWTEGVVNTILDAQGNFKHFLVVARDIAERKRLESQLRESQKMESLGTLSGGIAHEFNNILAVIMGYAELALEDSAKLPSLTPRLAMILDATQKAQDLVRQILTFSRQVVAELKPLDLDREVRQAAELFRQTLPRMISVEVNLAPGVKLVNGNPNQIQQIMLNLASNARDAMPLGGSLTLETARVELDEELCRERPGLEPGLYVLLRVSDNGRGMGQHTLEQAFDPFFTTKEVGKGTGLGLSTVHGLVQLHQGHIFCDSVLEKGTTFEIYLPALTGPEASEAPEPPEGDEAPQQDAPGGDEWILLVDDEPQLCSLGARFLEPKGYKVLTARDGETALEVFRRHGESLGLVILDLSMPGMGGIEALKKMLAISPAAKVIISTGYAGESQLRASFDAGARGFVAKPFRRVDFLATVREVLDQK